VSVPELCPDKIDPEESVPAVHGADRITGQVGRRVIGAEKGRGGDSPGKARGDA